MLGIVACSTPPAPPSPDAPMEMDPEGQFGVGCEGHTTPVTTYTMPRSEVGQTVNVRLEVPPHDGAVTFSVDGPDAAAFSIEQEDSGRTNLVLVSTEAKVYSATVVAWTDSTILARLSVMANVVPEAGPLRLSSPFVELDRDRTGSGPIILKNHSTSTSIDIDPADVTSDDGDLADVGVSSVPDCPATLGPGESCTIYVNSNPSELGCRRNHVTIHGSTNTVVLDIAISVGNDVRMFAGNGTISTNVGPSCTGNCVVSLVDGPVVATATPAPGFRFVGWSADSRCAAEPTCTLTFPTHYLQALFAPTFSPRTTITFAGAGHGHVLVSAGNTTVSCDRTCTVSALNPEDHIVLSAATMSPFGGWSGACNTTERQCNLGTPQQDRAVTVTFAKDAQEVATVSAPGVSRISGSYTGAFLSNGDIIIGTDSTISRVAMDGTVLWSHPASVLDVVVTPNDTIIYLSYRNTPTVVALDPAGARLWRRSLTSATWYGGPVDHFLAVTSTGDVATLVNGVATRISATTGLAIWRKDVPYGAAIAADHTGVIAIATIDSGSIVVHRYTLAGDEILPAWPIGTPAIITMAFDSDNALVVSRRNSTLSRYDVTGALVFGTTAFGSMAVAGNQIVQVGYGTGLDIEMTVTSSAGAPVSRLTKRASTTWYLLLSRPASDGLGRVAILGQEGTSSFGHSFAEILQIPP